MMKSQKLFEVLQWASSFLEENQREVGIAEILLQHHLKMDRTTFFQHMQTEIEPQIIEKFQNDIKIHIETGQPVQHLTGVAPFYGETFYVSPDVLIPRFETEELVEAVLQQIKSSPTAAPIVVDVGTGSGVIAIMLKKMMPEITMIATDISPGALKIAKKNAALHKTEIEFLQGDFLKPVIERNIIPNIIVSNPPYISYTDKANLSDTVKDFDPQLALFAEENGLAAYQKVIEQMKRMPLEDVYGLYLEIGYDQGVSVSELIQAAFPKGSIKVKKDINENDRIVIKHFS